MLQSPDSQAVVSQIQIPDAGSSMNKVLLVLPGGQMILTDLTDEECTRLNTPSSNGIELNVQADDDQGTDPTLVQPVVTNAARKTYGKKNVVALKPDGAVEEEDANDSSMMILS
ncbi:MAG TPA: hypothetical protein EYQ00_04810 [Dehalococcoidia bacterium]|nr:hypothetical protein [Dehalococcoidia bacterium]